MKKLWAFIVVFFIVCLMIRRVNTSSPTTFTLKASNGKYYKIRHRQSPEKMKQIAEILANIESKISQLISFLKLKHKDHPGVRRLSASSLNLEEIRPKYEGHVAYNVNKGETIGVCVTKGKGTVGGELEDINKIIFVVLHELAHTMTKEYKHNEIFWDNFGFLIKVAKELDLYTDTATHDTMCGETLGGFPE